MEASTNEITLLFVPRYPSATSAKMTLDSAWSRHPLRKLHPCLAAAGVERGPHLGLHGAIVA